MKTYSMFDKELYKVSELAELLNVSYRTIYRRIKDGSFGEEILMIKSTIHIPKKGLINYLKKQGAESLTEISNALRDAELKSEYNNKNLIVIYNYDLSDSQLKKLTKCVSEISDIDLTKILVKGCGDNDKQKVKY